ncbi:unnamed protein product [Alopecurus aequalis]
MEPLARVPPSREYHFVAEKMNFKVTVTLRASTVERWIRGVKKKFLDAAPIKCVGLDCEFTDPVPSVLQRELPPDDRQRAAVLQLSMASETLVFQICRADAVPQLLKEFLRDKTIQFCGAAIHNDLRMLRQYGIEISSAVDLQKAIPNPTNNTIPILYALANATIGTNLEKKKKGKADVEDDQIFGWGDVPLSFDQVKYAALDARLGFDIGRRHWNLHGYNSHVDRLNVVDE